jgi:hypothetical protein
VDLKFFRRVMRHSVEPIFEEVLPHDAKLRLSGSSRLVLNGSGASRRPSGVRSASRRTFAQKSKMSGQRRIVAIIDPQNHASIRLAEKIGMAFERMIRWEGQPTTLYAIQSGELIR